MLRCVRNHRKGFSFMSEYEDIQRLIDSTSENYELAAERILEELDARGFVTDDPDKAVGLKDRIYEIIENTIQGTFITPMEDGDLQNQL